MHNEDKLAQDNLIAHSSNVALLALLGGKRPRGGLWQKSKFDNQLEPATYGVSNSPFKWSPMLQVIIDVKVAFKKH
jgi:hypothetical protein